MTQPAKTAFVPERQSRRVVLEPHLVTTCGVIAQYRARAVSTLERYHRRRQITDRQFIAGQRLYKAWAVGICGAHDPEAGAGPWQPAGYTDTVLDAAQDYRQAVQFMGQRLSPVVLGVCCEDFTVERMAADWHRDRKGLMEVFRTALDHLADFYRLP
jgi:Domain of unknown function (DUF6456)